MGKLNLTYKIQKGANYFGSEVVIKKSGLLLTCRIFCIEFTDSSNTLVVGNKIFNYTAIVKYSVLYTSY